MKIKALHPDFKMPTKGSEFAGAFDLYMPEAGTIYPEEKKVAVPLGFSAEVPENHVALLLPRSSAGRNFGIMLRNTCGVIDADYRGEWIANLCLLNHDKPVNWAKGDRLLQMLIIPVASVELEQVEELGETKRGAGGFGSTGA